MFLLHVHKNIKGIKEISKENSKRSNAFYKMLKYIYKYMSGQAIHS